MSLVIAVGTPEGVLLGCDSFIGSAYERSTLDGCK